MKITIGHLYPDLLNLYGDRGNIQCLKMRLVWRGFDVEVKEFNLDDKVDFSKLDIVLLGGGSDREQMIVCRRLQSIRQDFSAYVEDGGVTLAVCGGYQLLGHRYSTPDGDMEGLHLADLYTEHGSPRLISNIVLEDPAYPYPIVGFENHGGRTRLGSGMKSLGRVVFGFGNNGEDHEEGVRYKNMIGTYLHGPLLPKNPHVCDDLLGRALRRRGHEEALSPLADTEEREANAALVRRFLHS